MQLFRSKNDVSSHRNRVHNKKDDFRCNHCDLEFSKKSNLKRHLEKVNRDNGSQEDPGVVNIVNILFTCPDCNQNYFNKSSLNRHQKNDHDKTGSVYSSTSNQNSKFSL